MLWPPTLCFLQCPGTPPGLFPTPFLHMNLHYVLGGTASHNTSANFKDSAGRVSGGKQTPTNGDKQFGEESHALLVSWPCGFLCAGVMRQNSNSFRARQMI